MWRYRDLPLQKKISIIIVVGLASAMIVTVANFISFDRDNVTRDLHEELSVLARITAARSAVALAFGDRVNALENLETLSLRSTIQHACIYNSERQLFVQYRRKFSKFDGCPNSLDVEGLYIGSDHPKLLEVVEPIFRKGLRLGYVMVASDLSPINIRTQKWIVTSFFVTLGALLIAFLLTRRMQYSVVRPIIELADLMDKVRNSNDLSLRATPSSRDEVGSLVESFNEMLEIVERHNHDLETLYRGLVEKSAEAESTAASLEVRNQQIKDLFSGAAHDLKQPLQAMTIFIDTLRKKTSDPNQQEIISKLKQATQNLSHLFNETLNVARYEYDLNKADAQTVPIKQLINKVFLEFEAMAQEKGLALRHHTQDYKVVAHGALLERIIRNLLSNAIRYTQRGGILLGCRRRGNQLAIEVWDTGRGIPEQKQKTIFTRFVQADDEDREKFGGFGMGLAIVKQFVDSLGYELSVKSVVGKGTVFSLLVPLYQETNVVSLKPKWAAAEQSPEQTSTQQALDSLHDHSETRILLVDDDEDIRAAIKMELTGWGFAVDDFADIASMLGYYRQGGSLPNLMISDYQLSANETGHDAVVAMRNYIHDDVPAFILSASEDEEVWKAIRDTGLPSMRKPVKPARLRALINHMLL